MNKALISIFIMFSAAMLSCVSETSPKSGRYTFLNRRQAIIVADTQTGEMYRVVLDAQGNDRWVKMGSPSLAK